MIDRMTVDEIQRNSESLIENISAMRNALDRIEILEAHRYRMRNLLELIRDTDSIPQTWSRVHETINEVLRETSG